MEAAETLNTLGSLPVGCRLLVRSRVDWRVAAVSKAAVEQIVLTVASPSGYNYRLKRDPDAAITFEGSIPILVADQGDTWHDNFSWYDIRW